MADRKTGLGPAADRRAGRSRDFNQVDAQLLRHAHRFINRYHAELLAFRANEPHLRDADAVVDAGLAAAGVLIAGAGLRRKGHAWCPSP